MDNIPSWIAEALNEVPCWARGAEDRIADAALNDSENYPEILINGNETKEAPCR